MNTNHLGLGWRECLVRDHDSVTESQFFLRSTAEPNNANGTHNLYNNDHPRPRTATTTLREY